MSSWDHLLGRWVFLHIIVQVRENWNVLLFFEISYHLIVESADREVVKFLKDVLIFVGVLGSMILVQVFRSQFVIEYQSLAKHILNINIKPINMYLKHVALLKISPWPSNMWVVKLSWRRCLILCLSRLWLLHHKSIGVVGSPTHLRFMTFRYTDAVCVSWCSLWKTLWMIWIGGI